MSARLEIILWFVAVFVLALCLLGLTACGTAPRPAPVVNMAVAGTCVPARLGPEPAGLETRETLAGAPDDAELLKRVYADWKVRVARMLETEPVIAACR